MTNDLNMFYIGFDSHDFSLEHDCVINTITTDDCVPRVDFSLREVTRLFKHQKGNMLLLCLSFISADMCRRTCMSLGLLTYIQLHLCSHL